MDKETGSDWTIDKEELSSCFADDELRVAFLEALEYSFEPSSQRYPLSELGYQLNERVDTFTDMVASMPEDASREKQMELVKTCAKTLGPIIWACNNIPKLDEIANASKNKQSTYIDFFKLVGGKLKKGFDELEELLPEHSINISLRESALDATQRNELLTIEAPSNQGALCIAAFRNGLKKE